MMFIPEPTPAYLAAWALILKSYGLLLQKEEWVQRTDVLQIVTEMRALDVTSPQFPIRSVELQADLMAAMQRLYPVRTTEGVH